MGPRASCWVARFADSEVNHRISEVHNATAWPRRPDRVLATARATYLWLPEGTMLWHDKNLYEPLDPAKARALLDSAGGTGPGTRAP